MKINHTDALKWERLLVLQIPLTIVAVIVYLIPAVWITFARGAYGFLIFAGIMNVAVFWYWIVIKNALITLYGNYSLWKLISISFKEN